MQHIVAIHYQKWRSRYLFPETLLAAKGLLWSRHFGRARNKTVRAAICAVAGHSYRKATSGSTLVARCAGR
jgi:hypothetical protein